MTERISYLARAYTPSGYVCGPSVSTRYNHRLIHRHVLNSLPHSCVTLHNGLPIRAIKLVIGLPAPEYHAAVVIFSPLLCQPHCAVRRLTIYSVLTGLYAVFADIWDTNWRNCTKHRLWYYMTECVQAANQHRNWIQYNGITTSLLPAITSNSL
jgi:hypothetical protein